MDAERIAEIRARVEEATPGPWERGDRYHVAGVLPARFGEGKCAYCSLMGEPEWAGRRDINGTKMLAHVHITDEAWSPHGIYAYPEPGSPDCVVVETDEYGLIGDADATFIAHARQDIPDLLAEVARLSAERDAARKRADERCEFDYKDGYEDGRAESDSTLLETVARLRAVIEEARARIANRKFGDDGTRIWIEDYMDDLGRLLDRGLKGEA